MNSFIQLKTWDNTFDPGYEYPPEPEIKYRDDKDDDGDLDDDGGRENGMYNIHHDN